jgi:hypothetical protein
MQPYPGTSLAIRGRPLAVSLIMNTSTRVGILPTYVPNSRLLIITEADVLRCPGSGLMNIKFKIFKVGILIMYVD